MATTAAPAATGATLKVALGLEPQGLDPGLAVVGSSHQIIDLVYSRLTNLDAEAKVVPDVAKSWDISDDGKTYTFHLRDDVFFQNGDKLTAEDVVFTFNRLTDPKTGYAYATQWESFKSAKALDDSTVQVELTQPTGPFLTFLAFPGSSIVPKKEVEARGNLSDSPVGSGPWNFVSYQPGSKLVLERNDKYYGAKPALQKLDIAYITDPTERANALLGGTVDFASQIDPKDYDRIVETPGFKGSEQVGGRWFFIMTQDTVSPLDNPKVRQAISLAVDRDVLSEVQFFGHAKPLLGAPIPEWNWAYAGDLQPFSPKADPEAARKLLAEAGYPDGLNLKLKTMSLVELASQAPLLQDMLKKAGINLEIEKMDNAVYLDKVWGGGEFEISNMYWLSPLADPDDFLYLNYKCGSGMNPQKYCNKDLDVLLEKARYSSSQEERAKYYHQAQELILKEMPLVPLVIQTNLDAFSDKVSGFLPMRTGMYSTLSNVTVGQ